MNAAETGKKLKSLRLKKGLKQSELAKELNVSDKLISKWETGISIPSTEFTLAICKFFDIDVNEFLGLSTNTTQEHTTLPHKLKVALLIIGGVLAFYILFSLIYFVIVPFSCKNLWLDDIDNHIQNILDRGYYSLEITTTVDGKTTTQKENAKLQDNVLYYERLSEKGGVLSTIVGSVEFDGHKSYKPFNLNIKNLSEILLYADKDDETAKFVENIDAKYILKTSNGYKMAVKDFTVSGASVHGKTIAEFSFDSEYLKKLDLSFKLKKDGKLYDCSGSVIFDLSAPPKDIVMYENSYIAWKTEQTYTLNDCTEEQLGGQVKKAVISDSRNVISAGNNLVFYDESNTISIYDGKTLALKNEFEVNDKILSSTLKHLFSTENHLYVATYLYDDDILEINLTDGTYRTLNFTNTNENLNTDTSQYFYVLPNGNIYYHVWHFGDNVEHLHLTKNHATGNYILGEVFHFDGTFVYTIVNENAPKNLTVRKYDLNDNLIDEFINLNTFYINLYSNTFIEYDNGKFYFSKASVDENFTNVTNYLWLNNFSPTVYAKHGNLLYSDLGILYTDKFKAPIAITDISHVYELDDFIVIRGVNNDFYSISK